MGITLVVGLIGILWYLKSRPENKGRELGKVILEQFSKYPLSFFLYLDVLFMIAEGGFAASIGDHLINPVFRFAGHLGLAFCSLVAAINFPKEVRRFFLTFKHFKRDWASIPLRFCIFVLILVLTVGLPWLNAFIIANGIHQFTELKLAFDYLNPFLSSDGMLTAVILAGKDPLYSPFAEMTYPMAATLGITITHMLLIVWKSLKLLDSADPVTRKAYLGDDIIEEEKEDKEEKDEEKKKDEENKKKDESPTSDSKALHTLFEFVGFSGTQLKTKVQKFARAILSKPEAEQLAIGQKIGPLARKARDLQTLIDAETDEKKLDKLEQRKEELINTIRTTFSNNRAADGIGMPMGAIEKN